MLISKQRILCRSLTLESTFLSCSHNKITETHTKIAAAKRLEKKINAYPLGKETEFKWMNYAKLDIQKIEIIE